MLTILPKVLKWTEIFGIITFIAGYLLKLLQYAGANELLLVSMLTLASTYFISGFIMVSVVDDGKPKTFTDLLPTILRKLMYIGLAVFLIGFLFSLLHLEGANEMLIIGVGTLVICSLISMLLILGKRERMTLLQAPLIRAIVALLIMLVSYLR